MKPSILFILIISLSVPAYSQVELQENVRYEGNTKLVIQSLGIALTVPEGWFGGIATGSPYMVLADASNEVTIIISADEMKESEVFGEMQRQISLDETISISPIGLVQKEGKRWWGNYTINGATQDMKCYVEVKLGDYNIGAGCILMAFPASFERGKKTVNDLIKGMSFQKPAQPQASVASSGSGPNQPYNDYLKGRSLKYFYTQGDFSETDFIHLCSNGTFMRTKNTISGGITGTGTLYGKDGGTWQASGHGTSGMLILMNQDGTQTEFQLEYREGTKGLGLYLNGYRYYVEASNQCN